MNWRDVLTKSPTEIQEASAEEMVARRIMKGLGASVKDIGKLCTRFGIEYNEEESSFHRAVRIFQEVYKDAKLIPFIDVRTGDVTKLLYDDLLEDTRTGVVFLRIKGQNVVTAFIKGNGLMTSALGQIVIKPGARYIANKDGMELWEQDPVNLIRSFSTN